MKKLLALILALTMVFALCACGATDEPKEPENNNAQTNEAEEYFVGFSCLITGNEQVMIIVDAITSYLESNGCKVQLTDANGDLPTQISHIENFATMDADLVIILSLDMDTLYEACTKAEEAGTKTFFFGMKPEYWQEISGCTAINYYNVGVAAADMLLMWIDEKYPDAGANSIPVAVSAMDSYADGKAINEGLAARLAEDGRCYVDYYENVTEVTSETGYNFMQNALTYNPDYKVFFCYNTGMSLGFDEYLTSNGYDLSEMCFVSTGAVSYAEEQVEASKNNESALRGFIGYGAADMGAYMGDIVIGLMSGTIEAPHIAYDPLYAVTAFDYEVPESLKGE